MPSLCPPALLARQFIAPIFAACVLISTVFAQGCSSAPPPGPSAKTGDACTGNSVCISNLCEHGVCTRACGTQGDCPEGFDCGLAADGDTATSCYKATYTVIEGGYGAGCPLYSGHCTSKPSPCATDFICLAATAFSPTGDRVEVACDPNAYCTKTGCATDTDCPPTMFCGKRNAADGDDQKLCLKRGYCSPCTTDDQCPTGDICATDANGGRFCAPKCTDTDPATNSDCHKQAVPFSGDRSYPPFEKCAGDANGTLVCQPQGGLCHGPSSITTIQGDAQVCSPCRAGIPSDCAGNEVCSGGTTGERFCTTGCSVHLAKSGSGYRSSADTCPSGAFCFFGGQVPQNCGNACDVQGECTGDSGRELPTCYAYP